MRRRIRKMKNSTHAYMDGRGTEADTDSGVLGGSNHEVMRRRLSTLLMSYRLIGCCFCGLHIGWRRE
ncbi:hypothetical protein E2C01_089388 [Portunus trituberculatus]|uniref:Uncharacterized protein n=1 Tax=Portunus trituberculatus TaxID=210409 RepID=A0A5B7JM94_PORTR|nr:hypothetical protein [Portunus trituberculatus]